MRTRCSKFAISTSYKIGDLISYHRSVAEYAHMYAAVFSIIVFSAVMVGLLEKAETKYFRPEKKKGQ